MQLIAVQVVAYTMPRVVAVEGALSLAVSPWRGITAGCARACAALKLTMVESVVWWSERWPMLSIDIYVDDLLVPGLADAECISVLQTR